MVQGAISHDYCLSHYRDLGLCPTASIMVNNLVKRQNFILMHLDFIAKKDFKEVFTLGQIVMNTCKKIILFMGAIKSIFK